MNLLKDKAFLWFVIRFILIYVIFYYGTVAFIGLTVPGGYYFPFLEHNLDYVSWLRSSLLHGTKAFLSIFGVNTYLATDFNLKMVNGRGIRLVYECIGYGVMSFWIAFVFASAGRIRRKILWAIGGLLFLWVLNIIRLSLLLVATNKGWAMPLGWDHHTWFTIFAYFFILMFMLLFNRRQNDLPAKQNDIK